MKLNQLNEAAKAVRGKEPNEDLKRYFDTGYLKPNANGEYRIINKSIKTLEGLFPETVNGWIELSNLNITDLVGCPSTLNNGFKCVLTEITSLEGGPEYVTGDYHVGNNDQLESLEGAPTFIGGAAMLLWNPKLTDLHNVHKLMPEIRGDIRFGNSVTKNVLGLLLISGLTQVSGLASTNIQNIINKYLPNKRGMEAVLECQDELIEYGREDAERYAHL